MLLVLHIDVLVLHKVSLVDKIFFNELDLLWRLEVALWLIILKHVEVVSCDITHFFTRKKVLRVSLLIRWKLTEPLIDLRKLLLVGKIDVVILGWSTVVSIIRVHLIHDIHRIS